MAALPELKEDSATVKAIYAAYEKRHANERRRSRRLGASILGRTCARQVWMDFRWVTQPEFDGRVLRLFQTGNLEEVRIAHNLIEIGCEVSLKDAGTGGQYEFTAVSGHIVCKIDAAILGLPEAAKTWHVGEFKTHNAKSFSALKSNGLKMAKPEHFYQLGVGMKLSGMSRGVYFAVNKDTDEIYTERLRWEEIEASINNMMDRAADVVAAPTPPEKIADSVDAYACKWCDHRETCHGSRVADVTCRSCVHGAAIIEDKGNGRWVCNKHQRTLSAAEQARACPDHLFIPALVPFAAADDAGYDPAGDWISYQNKDGTAWRNGKQRGDYKSLELVQLPPELVGAGSLVDAAKRELGAEVVEGVTS